MIKCAALVDAHERLSAESSPRCPSNLPPAPPPSNLCGGPCAPSAWRSQRPRDLRQRHRCGSMGSHRGDDPALVQRPDRGSRYQAQARQTTAVRTRQARLARSARSHLRIGASCITSEAEPKFHAETRPIRRWGHGPRFGRASREGESEAEKTTRVARFEEGPLGM